MSTTTSPQAVDDYMAKPYHIWLVRDDTGGTAQWVIGVDELPGCLSQGDTPEEAFEMMRDAMRLWIEVAIENGDPIPGPTPETGFSGKFQVRMPTSLHAQLVHEADREGASLNQFVVSALAAAVAWRRPATKANPEDESEETSRRAARRVG